MTDRPLPSPFHRRREAVRGRLPGLGVDALLVQTGENRFYLSGFSGEDGQCDESAGVVLLARDRTILATDSRYETQAAEETSGVEVVRYPRGWAYDLPRIVDGLSIERLGFESARMSVLQHDRLVRRLREAGSGVELVPVDGAVEGVRERKDPEEVAALRRAVAAAEAAFAALLPAVEAGMTEAEVAWALERRLREAGARGPSFPIIVAAGPNSALPHATPGSRRVAAGQPLLFDWGARVNGYCSDMSRTLCVGAPDGTFRKVFRTVREAQEKAIEAVAPGRSGREVDAVARGHIDAGEFSGRFGHSLGHGTGLAVHEGPRLGPNSDSILEPGMVVTVEPGIYLPGWGGVRLEQLVLVTDAGAEVLNELPVALDPLPG